MFFNSSGGLLYPSKVSWLLECAKNVLHQGKREVRLLSWALLGCCILE